MSKLLKAEFINAQALLEATTGRLETALNNAETSPSCIARLHANLAGAIEKIESFRPTRAAEMKDPLNYSDIVSNIGKAQLLLLSAEDRLPVDQVVELKPQPHFSTLPKLKLPSFDGNVEKYPKFVNAVRQIIDKPQIPAEEKLLHLQTALTGDAARVIENLPTTEATFENAMEKLKKKYDKPDQLITSIYEKIRNLPQATENTKSSPYHVR